MARREVDLGPVDAYAIAVAEGYTGTREEWVQTLADAEANGLKAEGYAVGEQNGTPVTSGEYFENNAKYYNEQAQSAKEDAETAQTAAETAQTAAETAQTAAETAQTAAETAAARDTAAWLNAHITNPNSPPLDRTLMSSSAAAPADMVGDLKSAFDGLNDAFDSVTTPEKEAVIGTQTASTTINDNKKVVDATPAYYTVSYTASAGEKLIINGAASNNGYVYIFTDSNGDTLSRYPEQNTSGGVKNYSGLEVVAPTGTANIVIASHTNYTPAYLQKIIGYFVDGMNELDERVEGIEDVIIDVPIPQDVPSTDITLHDNHFIYSDGTESPEYAAWQYAEYTLPDGAASVRVTGAAGQSAPLWLLKDATGTVLGYSADSSLVSAKTETVSLATYTGAKKLFVNDKKSGVLSIAIIYNRKEVDGDAVYIDGQSLPDVLDEIRSERSDKLYGKILCCVGDSITYGADMDSDGITNTSRITVYNCNDSGVFSQTLSGFRKTWGWQIADRHDMTFYNGGVSGSTMQNVTDHAGFSAADGRYTKLPDTLDYLLIWFGWNDNAYGTLGTIADDDNDSYYGGYNVVLPYLLNKYPYAKIGLIVPFGASAGHREAIRLLGNKWGVAVWDNYQGGTPLYYGKEDSVGVEASVVTANRAKFQALGAHPNFKGHTQLADMIEAWLKGI